MEGKGTPTTKLVAAFLDRVAHLDARQWQTIVAAQAALMADGERDMSLRKAAGDAVNRLAEETGRQLQYEALTTETIRSVKSWIAAAFASEPAEVQNDAFFKGGVAILTAAHLLLVSDVAPADLVAVEWRALDGVLPRPMAAAGPPGALSGDPMTAIRSVNPALRRDAWFALLAVALLGALVPAVIVLVIASWLGHANVGLILAAVVLVVLTAGYIRRRLSDTA